MKLEVKGRGFWQVVEAPNDRADFINDIAEKLWSEGWEYEAWQICTFFYEAYCLIEEHCPHELEGLIARAALGEKE